MREKAVNIFIDSVSPQEGNVSENNIRKERETRDQKILHQRRIKS